MRRKTRWIRLLLLVLAAFLLGGVAGVCALLHRPGWYTPVPLDRTRLQTDNSALINLVDRIGIALHRGQPAEILLDQQQVNHWFVAREEWPEAIGRLDLAPIADPLVLFLGEGRLRLAALARSADISAVISCDLRIMLDRERVIFGLEAARVGALPLPRTWIADFAERALADQPELQRLLRSGHASWPNDWVWPNGKRRFRIAECQVDKGAARLRIEPL